ELVTQPRLRIARKADFDSDPAAAQDEAHQVDEAGIVRPRVAAGVAGETARLHVHDRNPLRVPTFVTIQPIVSIALGIRAQQRPAAAARFGFEPCLKAGVAADFSLPGSDALQELLLPLRFVTAGKLDAEVVRPCRSEESHTCGV